ncbi:MULTISPECIES: phosphoribosylaminoimidazolesuccinocarboxamide synthase [Gardnerella]|jgi:phosphoribosylaminoimidazolesuccinocarboxamide synthase|uniref:Phosphoribosylaminoimidazole-succinocarboxamide synthase n=1 Tax=Gardnerella swidsinskii TaxID=2792979 RepID=A0ABM6GJS1_9BIFI|nr:MULTISPECIES: phosphoribosylaminoimidazolesuccinocarboxamide synthase [Gardnerella]APW18996.1 phosphoribosylaminoimidazolesuccinocarboxamide synthase [Gardnerella vaginalis]RIY25878.1 phosphoribosylaminoimidazolesuccinocarboxamide synthase [Bifidobacteriaceae bacterium WP021]MDK8691387.1 phosphoribosylaminoimidazolesuccinocarboxamide synthase [Gardnerella swidsinskii]PMC44106.1 phosphoribosylaminoimidazolesuccinocarboxamide synthase [Gardnerella vaginalis]PMC51341.1 phosphoribosylaminoimida
MEKLEKLYEGKAKKLYATDDTNVLWVEYMNQATAGNGLKKAQIAGKGSLNNRITSLLFHLLEARGVKSHFLGRISDTEQLVKRMRMFPLEIIMRNTAAGSFAKRYNVKEGTPLKKPLLEFCVKSDELGDPFINPEGVVALGLATDEEMTEVTRQAHAVNNALLDIFSKIDVQLVDFKIEEGVDAQGNILLADEITPDTCRLWDKRNAGTNEVSHLDKDLFRRDLGDIIPAYEEIYDRLASLAQSEGLDVSVRKPDDCVER